MAVAGAGNLDPAVLIALAGSIGFRRALGLAGKFFGGVEYCGTPAGNHIARIRGASRDHGRPSAKAKLRHTPLPAGILLLIHWFIADCRCCLRGCGERIAGGVGRGANPPPADGAGDLAREQRRSKARKP